MSFVAVFFCILFDLGFGAPVFPSEARIRIDGCEDASSVGWLALRRGFWVRKTEPRDLWEVLVRRFVREEKNWVYTRQCNAGDVLSCDLCTSSLLRCGAISEWTDLRSVLVVRFFCWLLLSRKSGKTECV